MPTRVCWILVAILGMVSLSLTSRLCVAQIGGSFGGGGDPVVPTPRSDLALLHDLPKKELPFKGHLPPARFQIVTVNSHTLLLDTATGDTWVLTANEKEHGKLHWLEVPRPSSKRQPERPEEPPVPATRPSQPVEEDPFR